MEEALGWLAWLESMDAKIVWLRANGERWKTVCWKIGLGCAAANEALAVCLVCYRMASQTGGIFRVNGLSVT
jgi:hypothetical protein